MSDTPIITPSKGGGPVRLTPDPVEKHLKYRGFSLDHMDTAFAQGHLRLVDKDEARSILGHGKDVDKCEYLLLQDRGGTGQIIGFYKDPFTHQWNNTKLNPFSHVAHVDAHVYGEGWQNLSGEVYIHESPLKGLLQYLQHGGNVIALTGIDAVVYQDGKTDKRVIDVLHSPPWDYDNTDVSIVFDSPKKGNRKSEEGLLSAKTKIVGLLAGKCRAVFDQSCPPPTDSRESQDYNDLSRDMGTEALAYLRQRRRLMASPNPTAALINGAALSQREAPAWFIDNLLPVNDLGLVYGPTSCGKSFMTMDMLLAVSRGLDYWLQPEHHIYRSGLVVHMAFEGSGLTNRVNAYLKKHELQPEDIANYFALEVPITFANPNEVEKLITAIKDLEQETGLPLVCFAVDTVSRALQGAEENSASEASKLTAACYTLVNAFENSAGVLVHHQGKKAENGPRGSQVWSDHVGSKLKIEEKDAGVRQVELEKLRDGERGRCFYFTLDVVSLGTNGQGRPVTSCAVIPAVAPKYIDVEPGTSADAKRHMEEWCAEHGVKLSTNFVERGSNTYPKEALLDYVNGKMGKAYTANNLATIVRGADVDDDSNY